MTGVALTVCLIVLLGLLTVVVRLAWDLYAFHREMNRKGGRA